jgi:Tfp pilus assembly protein PilV
MQYVSRRNSGFVLPEILIAMGIMVVLTLGSAALIADFYKKHSNAASKNDFIQSSNLLKSFLQREQSSVNPRTCLDTLSFEGSVNTAAQQSGKKEIKLTLGTGPDDKFEAGTVVPGSPGYRINSIYLSDFEQIDKTATKTSYVATVYVEAMASTDAEQTTLKMAKRAVSTVAIQVDSTTGAMVNCNMASTLGENQEVCSSISGMVWNPITQQCDNSAYREANGEFRCPPATVLRTTDGVCVPQYQNCSGNSLAKGFSHGLVECAQPPPVNNIVGLPNGGAQPVVPIGNPPAPQPSPPYTTKLIGPVMFQDIPAPGSTAPPSKCVSANSLGEYNYQACTEDYAGMNSSGIAMQGEFACGFNPALVYSADSQTCSAEVSRNYSVPNLTTAQPSIRPPVVTSCRCDKHTIADGEYCVFCVKDADLGWGYADYTYSVSRCQSGNLVHLNNIQSSEVDMTPPTCSGGYKRGVLTGGKFRQVTD